MTSLMKPWVSMMNKRMRMKMSLLNKKTKMRSQNKMRLMRYSTKSTNKSFKRNSRAQVIFNQSRARSIRKLFLIRKEIDKMMHQTMKSHHPSDNAASSTRSVLIWSI